MLISYVTSFSTYLAVAKLKINSELIIMKLWASIDDQNVISRSSLFNVMVHGGFSFKDLFQ